MGKRTDKSVKTGAVSSANSRGADECSTPEPYTCTGNFTDDFTELWQRSGMQKHHMPIIRARAKCPITPPAEEVKLSPDEEEGERVTENPPPLTYSVVDNLEMLRPSLQVEFELEETKQFQISHAKELFIRSWKLEEKIVSVLKQCAMERLQCLNLWNVGLSENSLEALSVFIPLLPNIKTLILDGNPIPESEPYFKLLSHDSPLQHIFLRNNQITDIGAQKIGERLGSDKLQPRYLSSLNLSFNRIADKGATELAKGLRMNRILLSLSLAANHIADEGCKALAHVLQRFPLTHDEVVQRRKLISQQGYYARGTSAPGSRRGDSKDRPGSNRSGSQMATKGSRGSSKKKPEAKKVEVPEKTPKKDEKTKKGASVATEPSKVTKGKKSGGGGKEGGKRNTALSTNMDVDSTDAPEFIHPLLDAQAEHTDGKVFVSGCMTLVNLNLSRNKIGILGLEALWTAVQFQASRHRLFLAPASSPGLLKLALTKNSFALDHPVYVKMMEVMTSRDPMTKAGSKTPDDEIQSVMS